MTTPAPAKGRRTPRRSPPDPTSAEALATPPPVPILAGFRIERAGPKGRRAILSANGRDVLILGFTDRNAMLRVFHLMWDAINADTRCDDCDKDIVGATFVIEGEDALIFCSACADARTGRAPGG